MMRITLHGHINSALAAIVREVEIIVTPQTIAHQVWLFYREYKTRHGIAFNRVIVTGV
jgi:hypothetical protein